MYSKIRCLEKNPDKNGNPHKDKLAISIAVIVMGICVDTFPIRRMSWAWWWR